MSPLLKPIPNYVLLEIETIFLSFTDKNLHYKKLMTPSKNLNISSIHALRKHKYAVIVKQGVKVSRVE